jgi:hypothetical protein
MNQKSKLMRAQKITAYLNKYRNNKTYNTMTRNIKEESKIPITTMEELNQMADAINAL